MTSPTIGTATATGSAFQRCANQPASDDGAGEREQADAEPGGAAHQHRRRRAPARQPGRVDLGAHVLAGERERLAQIESRAQLLAPPPGARAPRRRRRARAACAPASPRPSACAPCTAARRASPCRTDRGRARRDARRRRSARRLRRARPSAPRCAAGRAPSSRRRAAPAARALGAIVHADEHDEEHHRHGDEDAGRAVRGRRPHRGSGEEKRRHARVRQHRRAPIGGGDRLLACGAASTVLGGGVALAHGVIIPRACYIAAHGRRCASPTARASGATASSGAAEMVRGGPIDVLTGDYLAELTMAILAKQRAARARRLGRHVPRADGGGARRVHDARDQDRVERRRARSARPRRRARGAGAQARRARAHRRRRR